MAEITFINNKARKERFKYIFVFVFALITWILQVSIINQFLFFDTTPNLILLGNIYCGLTFGPLFGTIFGITSSFFTSSILYDHVFYFSYPLIGFLAGMLTKNLFSDDLLLFIILSFVLTFFCELLNGWQYSIINPVNISSRYFLISFFGAILNLLIAPFFFILMRFITKDIK